LLTPTQATLGGGLSLFLALAATVDAQANRPALDVASLSPDAAAVYRTWNEYLASKEGAFHSRANVPSPLWVMSEQRQWPVYDLAGFYLSDGAIPKVTGIVRADAPNAQEYRITTRFRSGDRKGRPPAPSDEALVTVYAVRDGARWLLANALPRQTQAWRRDTVGPITYVYAPEYPYDRSRARRAVAFTDSVATAFGVPRLPPITYYLASSVDEVNKIMGLQYDEKSGPGGRAQPVNRQLFSGIPAVGEEYRHELAHLVLMPLVGAQTLYFVSEGVPTWLGGTTGMDFATAARGLAAFLTEHPTVSLDSLVSGSFPPAQTYPAGAVVAEMVFEEGGVDAVKALFNAGGTAAEFRATLEHLLKRPWLAINGDWHRRVMRFQPGLASPRPPRHNEQLLLSAHASEAARSLRSRAAFLMIAPQQNCGR